MDEKKLIQIYMRNELLKYSDLELEYFVRKRLGQKNISLSSMPSGKEHLRLEFSGYDFLGNGEKPDECTFVNNNKILFLFADCGIFDFVHYLILHSWKGGMNLEYCFVYENKENEEKDYSGHGTVEIIKDIINFFYIIRRKKGLIPKREIEYKKNILTDEKTFLTMEVEDLKCGKCGSVNDYKIVPKGNARTAWCNCGAYIKHIGYAEPQFYVGKYKGTLIKDCKDKQYLTWFAENVAKGKAKEVIIKRISEL